jgi:uncharacterized protein YbjT (DUF2867 family)
MIAIQFSINIKCLFFNIIGRIQDLSRQIKKTAADVLVAGATGLIGGAFLKQVVDDPSVGKVIAMTRREIPSITGTPHIQQEIINFDNLQIYQQVLSAHTLVCALGTTIKKAGTKEKFRQVDYQLPLDIATYAAKKGCKIFILVSAIGADPNASVFYNKVKGELERDIQKLPFKAVHIIRPSLLMGEREEFRPGEEIGKLLIQPLSFLIPGKYKPVHVDVIACKIKSLLKDDSPGTHIYEGRQIHK